MGSAQRFVKIIKIKKLTFDWLPQKLLDFMQFKFFSALTH
jgi:hypothetical protein